MSLETLLTQDVTILHPALKTNRVNDALDDWSAAIREATKGDLQQTDSTEITVGRDTIVTNLRLFLLPSASIDARCRVLVGGKTYEVVGDPYLPLGDHWEVSVRHLEG